MKNRKEILMVMLITGGTEWQSQNSLRNLGIGQAQLSARAARGVQIYSEYARRQ